jgi:hypothetical protein
MKRYLFLCLIALIVLVSCVPLPSQPMGFKLTTGWQDLIIARYALTSSALDLGDNYEYLNVYIPTIDAGAVSVYVSDTLTGTYAADNLSTASHSSSTGGVFTTLGIGGFRYIKIVTENQTSAAVTFKIRAWNP